MVLTSIWNPGPDLSLCVEGETVQNTFGVVIGSGFPTAVTEMGQVVVSSYRPLPSWRTGKSSRVELTPFSPSAHATRGVTANGAGPE